MNLIYEGLEKAINLIINIDPEILKISILSIKVSGISTLLAIIIGIPFGYFLSISNFPGKKLVISLINTGMSFPPVVIGLLVTITLWRSGPLGFLNLLYTPSAIIIAQTIIVFPIVAGLSTASFQQIDKNLILQILSLGASKIQLFWILIREIKLPIIATIIAGFGGAISEVGASMMVGGNILNYTRVLTTATLLETSKGNFEMAIALSIILLLLTFIINLILTLIQQKKI